MNVFDNESFDLSEVKVEYPFIKLRDIKTDCEYIANVFNHVYRGTDFNYKNIPEDLYKIKIFKPENNDKEIYNLCLTISINPDKLSEIVKNGRQIPLKMFLTDILKFTYKINDTKMRNMIQNIMNPVKYTNTSFNYSSEINKSLFVYQRENVKWMLNLEKNFFRKQFEFKQPDTVKIGDVCIDLRNNVVGLSENISNMKVHFLGGGLLDGTGLGKCIADDEIVPIYYGPETQSFSNLDMLSAKDIYQKYKSDLGRYDGSGW